MADLGASYLEGARFGANIVGQGVNAFEEARTYRDKLKAQAEQHDAAAAALKTEAERYAEGRKPLDESQLADIAAGNPPRNRPAAEQEAFGKSEQMIKAREDAAANKAATDALKGHTVLTQEQIDKTPAYKKANLVPGNYPDTFINQQTKSPSGTGKTEQAATDAVNRKIVTEYAAKNKKSLDAIRPGGMGGWNSANLAMAADMIKSHPDYDVAGLKAAFAGQMRGETTAAAKAADIKVNLNSAHSGFSTVMDKAADLAAKMGQGKIATFNEAVQAGRSQFNDPDTTAFYTLLDEAAGNYGRITKGGSASIGEQDKRDALKILSARLNAGGIRAVKDAVETEYRGRLKGLPGGSETTAPKISAAEQKKLYSSPAAQDIRAAYSRGDYGTGEAARAKASEELDKLYTTGAR